MKTYLPDASFTFRGITYKLFRRSATKTAPLYFRVKPPGQKRRLINTRHTSEKLAAKAAKILLAEILDADPPAFANAATVAELVPQILLAKRADGLSSLHVADIERRLSPFLDAFGDRLAGDIKTHEVDDWLRNLKIRQKGVANFGKAVSPVTRNKFRAILSLFFDFAKKRQAADSNPVLDTVRVSEPKSPILVPSPAQVLALLNAAPAELRAFFSLRAFAGLRSSEAQALDWSAVDLEGKLIEISESKSPNPRHVEISANLMDWLKPLKAAGGPVVTFNADRIAKEQRALALLVEGWGGKWPRKNLRHAWFSFHVAHFSNAPYTALQGGHNGNPAMLYRKYRGIKTLDGERITSDLARDYWGTYPDGIHPERADEEERKIIRFG